jgi:Flp pilus assembly pilin Flp
MMHRMKTALRRLAREGDGQDLLEYGLLVALIVLAAVGAVRTVGTTIYDVFWSGIGQVI